VSSNPYRHCLAREGAKAAIFQPAGARFASIGNDHIDRVINKPNFLDRAGLPRLKRLPYLRPETAWASHFIHVIAERRLG
jgi:hypothetical protein